MSALELKIVSPTEKVAGVAQRVQPGPPTPKSQLVHLDRDTYALARSGKKQVLKVSKTACDMLFQLLTTMPASFRSLQYDRLGLRLRHLLGGRNCVCLMLDWCSRAC